MDTDLVRATRSAAGTLIVVLTGMAVAGPAWSQPDPYRTLAFEWTAPGDDGDSGQASGYDLRYSTTAVGSDTTGWWNAAMRAATPVPGPPGSTDSTRVTALQSGRTYYVMLRTFDDSGLFSSFSNVTSATTLTCYAPALAPQQLAAVEDSDGVELSWSPTSDTLAVYMHLYRATGSGSMTLLAQLTAATTNYRDTTTRPGTTYRYAAAWASTCGDGPTTSPPLQLTTAGTGSGSAEDLSTLHAFPNPSSGALQFNLYVSGPTAQRAHIRVYDMEGHWIADLVDAMFAPGNSLVPWGAVSGSGNRVAPGYYEVLGTVGLQRVRERIVLLP